MTDENQDPTAVAEAEPIHDAAVQADPAEQSLAQVTTGARIILKRGGVPTELVYELHPPTTIGRFDPGVGPIDVDLGTQPEGAYVSRKHAKIVLDDGVWKLVDLGSSNGTFVLRDDFERIEEAELTDGQEFALGNARFVFELTGV